MRWKRFLLYTKYYFRKARKSFNLSILLFGLSITLFLCILIPNILHRLPIFKNWEKIYSIKGELTFPDNYKPTKKFYVEIGGHKTQINNNGTFELRFPSRTSKNIPILISFEDSILFYRISYSNDELSIDTTLRFNGITNRFKSQ